MLIERRMSFDLIIVVINLFRTFALDEDDITRPIFHTTVKWQEFVEQHNDRFEEIKNSLLLPDSENGEKNVFLLHIEAYWIKCDEQIKSLNESVKKNLMIGSYVTV
jgi:hypothetical protein